MPAILFECVRDRGIGKEKAELHTNVHRAAFLAPGCLPPADTTPAQLTKLCRNASSMTVLAGGSSSRLVSSLNELTAVLLAWDGFSAPAFCRGRETNIILVNVGASLEM